MIFGNKDVFAISLEKCNSIFQLSFFVNEQDILQLERNGMVYSYKWEDCDEIIEWFEDNIAYIEKIDEFPIEIEGENAAEMCKNCFEEDFDEVEKYELLQEWMFRHSWFSARAGSFLADVFFRKINNGIEISWENKELFKEEEIKFMFPRGCICVEVNIFDEIIKKFILNYKLLRQLL